MAIRANRDEICFIIYLVVLSNGMEWFSVVYVNKILAHIAIDFLKIETAQVANAAVELDTLSPGNRATLVLVDSDLLLEAFKYVDIGVDDFRKEIIIINIGKIGPERN